MSELRGRMIRDLTLRGFSPRTHKSYLAAVVGLAKHHRRSPDQLTKPSSASRGRSGKRCGPPMEVSRGFLG